MLLQNRFLVYCCIVLALFVGWRTYSHSDYRSIGVGFSERANDNNWADFKVSEQFTDAMIAHYIRDREIPVELPSIELGPKGEMIAKSLMTIEGVEEIWFTPDEVGVVKGAAFKWSELKPKIEESIISGIKLKEKTYVPGSRPILEKDVPVAVIKSDEHPGRRVFAFRQPVSERWIQMYWYPCWSEIPISSEVGRLGASLTENLNKLDNEDIDMVFLVPYGVNIHLVKGKQWTPKLEAEIKKALRQAVANDNRINVI